MKSRLEGFRKFSLTYKVLKFLERRGFLKNISFTLSNPNHKFSKVPIIQGMGLGNLINIEPWMDEVLRKIKRSLKGKSFIDIGVNIGQTLIKIKDFDKNINYIGFEPNPYCVFYVNELISINKIENVRILPVGLSKETSIVELSMKNESNVDGGASIIPNFRKNNFKKVDVLVTTLSNVEVINEMNVGCIKIDVEGAEMEVLEGLYEIIKKNKPMIICEVLPVYNKKNKNRIERQLRIEKMISELGYVIYRVNTDDGSLQRIEGFGIHANLDLTNYVFSHEELS